MVDIIDETSGSGTSTYESIRLPEPKLCKFRPTSFRSVVLGTIKKLLPSYSTYHHP